MAQRRKKSNATRRVFHAVGIALVLLILLLTVLVTLTNKSTTIGQAIQLLPTICYDNDYGRYYDTKGKTLVNGEVYEDECVSLEILREYECRDDVTFMWKEQKCQYGCFDGACRYP